MTDLGCAGCEWAKGQHAILKTTIDDMQLRYDSKTADAQVVADCARYQGERLKEDFDKMKILTMDAIGDARRAAKATDEIKADNVDFKKTISRELRGIMLQQIVGSAIGSGVMIGVLTAVAKFILKM